MTEAARAVRGRWDGGSCPFEAGWHKVMMWAFIITDGLMFAGFLASYGYARAMSTAGWPEQSEVFEIPMIALMTFILITSSATMASAVGLTKSGDPKGGIKYVLATVAGGAVFLGMQAWEWSALIHEGVTPGGNPFGDAAFGAYFYLITGFHGTHVLSGVLVLAILAGRMSKGLATETGVEMAGLYWHFVDLVWVFVFTTFYLL